MRKITFLIIYILLGVSTLYARENETVGSINYIKVDFQELFKTPKVYNQKRVVMQFIVIYNFEQIIIIPDNKDNDKILDCNDVSATQISKEVDEGYQSFCWFTSSENRATPQNKKFKYGNVYLLKAYGLFKYNGKKDNRFNWFESEFISDKEEILRQTYFAENLETFLDNARRIVLILVNPKYSREDILNNKMIGTRINSRNKTTYFIVKPLTNRESPYSRETLKKIVSSFGNDLVSKLPEKLYISDTDCVSDIWDLVGVESPSIYYKGELNIFRSFLEKNFEIVEVH